MFLATVESFHVFEVFVIIKNNNVGIVFIFYIVGKATTTFLRVRKIASKSPVVKGLILNWGRECSFTYIQSAILSTLARHLFLLPFLRVTGERPKQFK